MNNFKNIKINMQKLINNPIIILSFLISISFVGIVVIPFYLLENFIQFKFVIFIRRIVTLDLIN